MQPPYLWNRNHLTTSRRLNIAGKRRVAIRRQVGPRFVGIIELIGQNPLQVSLVENDSMVKALATDRTDESLEIRRLPWRLVRDHHLPDTHVLASLLEEGTVDTVVTAIHEPRRGVIGKRFDDMLSRPLGRWMSGDVEMDDVAAVVAHDRKGKEYPEGSRRDGEEVDGHDFSRMIVQECSPGL